jgi:hypothetical protein
MSNEQKIPHIDNLQKRREERTSDPRNLDFLVFRLNLQSEQFEELKLTNNDKVKNLLDHDVMLLFLDNLNSRVWIWEGKNTSPRMKFISAEAAHKIRDQHAFDYTITTIDDGDEPIEFKTILGLELEA